MFTFPDKFCFMLFHHIKTLGYFRENQKRFLFGILDEIVYVNRKFGKAEKGYLYSLSGKKTIRKKIEKLEKADERLKKRKKEQKKTKRKRGSGKKIAVGTADGTSMHSGSRLCGWGCVLSRIDFYPGTEINGVKSRPGQTVSEKGR